MRHQGEARRAILTVTVGLIAALALCSSLVPAVIVVDAGCTLEDAITAANTDGPVGGCSAGSGPDELQLTQDVVLASPLPPIETNISIQADGFAISRDETTGAFRLFTVGSNAVFEIFDATLSNGDGGDRGGAIAVATGEARINGSHLISNTAEDGGAIYVSAAARGAVLTNSTVSANSAQKGGGIFHRGRVLLVNSQVTQNSSNDGGGIYSLAYRYSPKPIFDATEGSSISDNVSSGVGGGISAHWYAEVRISDSSISNNTAGGSGGGLWMQGNYGGGYTGHIVTIVNSMISGNSSDGSGGGALLDRGYELYAPGVMTIENSTFSGNYAAVSGGGVLHRNGEIVFTNTTISANSSPNGGGAYVLADTGLELNGSIVAGNPAGGNCVGPGVAGASIANSFDDDGSCGDSSAIVPGVDFETDLADNGGPTETHALLTDSVAIDAAGDCGLTTDQRGFERVDGACDAGAFEFGVGPFPLSLVGECPGAATVSLVAAAPKTTVELFAGNAGGSVQVPVGACAGTLLDIGPALNIATLTTDASGAASEVLQFTSNQCGRVLQGVDESDCELSTLETIDSCHALGTFHIGSGADPVPSIPSSAGCPDGEYVPGEVIHLTASPDGGWSVGSWSGTDDDGTTSDTNLLTMPVGDHVVSVTYVQSCSTLSLTHSGAGGDPIASPPSSPACPLGEYAPGEVIDLTASPDADWQVVGWSGTDDDASTQSTNTLTFPGQPHVVDVIYALSCFDLTLAHTGAGSDPLALPQGDASLWAKRPIDGSFAGATSVRPADIDGDGDLDVVAAAEDGAQLAWWENSSGDGDVWVKHVVDGALSSPQGVAAADVDGDGDTDLLGTSLVLGAVFWWENDGGDGTVWVKREIENGLSSPWDLHPTDIDGDGDIDVAAAIFGDNDLLWWENTTGDGTAWSRNNVDVSLFLAISVWADDVDGDGDMDLLGSGDNANLISWWENVGGDGTAWLEHRVVQNYTNPYSVRTADVDGDGDVDVLGNSFWDNGRAVAWWENDGGDGISWTEHLIDDDFDFARSVYPADLDGDGDVDVAGVSTVLHDVTWWENTDGDGTIWIERTIEGFFEGADEIFVADIDGDGDPDILGAAEDGNDVTWWENEYDGGCPAGSFNADDRFALLAAPDPGSEIGGWSGTDNDASTEPTNTAAMPANDHIIAVDYVESVLGPLITVSGSCPGVITVDASTTTPDEQVLLFAGTNDGATVLDSGSCQGTELDITDGQSWLNLTTDENGEGSVDRQIGSAWCGRRLQALDRACQPGNVVTIP